MNDAATATAIFPFRQPQERESTIRSRARSGPATTPPRHQVPSSPEGEHPSDDRHRGAKQPASADRGKPDRNTSDHERGVSTGGNSEKRNELPSNVIDTRKPTVISQYPERKTSSQTPDYPQQGNQQRVSRSRNRNGAQQSRSENPRPYGGCVLSIPKRPMPARAGKPDSYAHSSSSSWAHPRAHRSVNTTKRSTAVSTQNPAINSEHRRTPRQPGIHRSDLQHRARRDRRSRHQRADEAQNPIHVIHPHSSRTR